MIRRELTNAARLAAAVLDGLPADGVHEKLEELRSNGMLWQFQVSCLRYLVHLHHHAEDTTSSTNSDYLDAVVAAARALSEDDSHDARRAVADALEVLEGHLLAHLDYEEQNVAGTARRLRDFRPLTRQRRA